MEYIMITLSAIAISALAVYHIVNKVFGVELRAQPLILCAVSAVLISVVLPRFIVSFAGVTGTLTILAVIAFIFAYFMASFADDFQVRTSVLKETLSMAGAEINTKMDVHTVQHVEPYVDRNSGDDHESQLLLCKPHDYVIEEEPNIQLLTGGVTKAEDDDKQDKVQSCDSIASQNEQATSQSLDDLMDFAFRQKEQHELTQALNTFRKTLDLYPDSDAAPYLAVEIGGILKHKGAYDQAIDAFIKGRDLAKQHGNEMLELELINVIAYLRIVKNILLEKHIGFVPFDSISGEIIAEIDREFAEWRNLE